jgi:chromosome segregation ATPase
MYRFEVKLPAGQSADVPVTEERDIQQRIAITNLDSQQIRFYLQQQSISQKVKDALAEALKLQNQLQQTRAAMAQIEKQLDEINRDQERLRKNLKEMPPTAAAYKRYLDKFDAQESQIEKLQAEQKRLMETEASQRKAYDTFLSNLTVE